MTEERRRIPDEFEVTTSHSGFATHIGPYHAAQLENDRGEREYWLGLKVDERHGGRRGGEFGHGGMLLALLDEVMGRAASQASQMVCMTVSMHTNFCGPFRDGDFLRAAGHVTRLGRSLVFVDGRVLCANKLIGTASGVWMITSQPLPS
jgi:acyl-coenzyme A thioesterase PaaI-like protein